MTKSKRWLAMVVWLWSVPGRGDILDQDQDEGPVRPQPGVVAPAKPQPPASPRRGDADTTEGDTGGAKAQRVPTIDTSSDRDDGASGIREPVAHAKNTGSATTTVIPPKNAAKPAATTKAKGGKAKAGPQLPVHFESRGLKGLRPQGMVELLQDVVVTQGEMKLDSEHALVYFNEASHEVQKVVAEGNVRINGVDENSGEKFKAFGDKAVFMNSERTVVLEGNAKLWRGEDSVIRSRKITYEMNTGWIRADRVAGEVQPEATASKPVGGAAATKGKDVEKGQAKGAVAPAGGDDDASAASRGAKPKAEGSRK